jgi:hypothetical protein
MRVLLIILGLVVLAFAIYVAAGPAIESFRDGRGGGGRHHGGGGGGRPGGSRHHGGGGGHHPGGRHYRPGYTYVGGGGSSDWGWSWGWPAWGWAWGWPWSVSCELTGCPAGSACVYDPLGYSYCA